MHYPVSWIAITSLLTLASPRVDVPQLVRTLRQVDKEGEGNGAAQAAWRIVVGHTDAATVPLLLEAMDGANPLAANWLWSAADALSRRITREGGDLPREALEKFLADTGHAPRARQLAFDWIVHVEPSARERWLPRFRDDPSVDLRREAVGALLADAAAVDEKNEPDAARELYGEALAAARDTDQIEKAAKRLRELGEEVDLARHFGFIRAWEVLGPFDNTGNRGFATSYPPEKKVDLEEEYQGKHGDVGWKSVATDGEYGIIDLNRGIVHEKGVIAYAYHEFHSGETRDAEVRIATVNAWKLWVNGEFLGERDEYHHGTRIDHYRVPVRLERGKNRILFKSCQNEQTEDYADPWRFQLRISDTTGTAILPVEEKR